MGQESSKKEIEFQKIQTQHNVVPSIYNNSSLLPYGTSSFLEILSIPPFSVYKEEFNFISDNIYEERLSIFKKIYDLIFEYKEIIEPSHEILKYNVDQVLLNPWIMSSTFELIEEVIKSNREKTDIQIVKEFVREVNFFPIQNKKDFLLNWGFFLYYFNLNLYNSMIQNYNWPIYHDNPYSIQLKEFMIKIIKEIQNYYKINPKQFVSSKIDETFIIIIPKKFYLYRAYEKHKDVWGDLTYGMWASVNGSDIIDYVIPELGQDEEEIINNTSKLYCQETRNIAIFKTKKELKLLDFSNQETLDYIFDIMKENEELRTIFEQAYKKRRYSIKKDDKKIAYFLCAHGFDGYINFFETSGFHDEVMICKQKENLEFIEICTNGDINLNICSDPYIRYDLLLDLSF